MKSCGGAGAQVENTLTSSTNIKVKTTDMVASGYVT